MTDFELKTAENATDEGRAALERAQAAFDFAPNLVKVLANAPAAAHAYLDLGERLESTSLSPQERQVVLLATSFEHQCEYCMAAHSMVAGMVGIEDDDLRALREGKELPTPRLEALRRFTRAVVEKRGNVDDADLRRFREAGFEKAQILEVILGVAMKTLSNYTNHIAGTPLDEAFEAQRWQAPLTVAAG
ncbi:MAG TPA: carboxymuconolactone decarboxylase family protein [Longimicrobiaceae bacterium]|nr:carboxymuconolactone decarboxylase family protein [Longimicrobiaceae bacterium]